MITGILILGLHYLVIAAVIYVLAAIINRLLPNLIPMDIVRLVIGLIGIIYVVRVAEILISGASTLPNGGWL